MGCSARRNRRLTVRAPGLGTLRDYQRAWLRGDLIAGVTVAAYLIPQVMAYAGLAGLPPVTGLWAALPPLACYAMLGSSRLVSLGPESTTALMTAVTVGPLAAGDPARYAELATVLALLVGALAIVAWLVRLGFVADLLSRPVVIGYLAGVALIMVSGQLGRLTGVPVTGESFTSQVTSFVHRMPQGRPGDAVIAAAVLAFLFAARAWWPRLPGPLAAVLLNTEANMQVDFTALEAVEAVRAELSDRGIIVGLARVKRDLLDDLQAFGLVQKIGPERIFPTLPTAVAAYQEWARQHPNGAAIRA